MKQLTNLQKNRIGFITDRVLCFLSVFFVSAAIFVSLAKSAQIGISIRIELFAYALLMIVGYALQSAECALRHFKRKEDVFAYESLTKHYSFSQALPVYILGAITGIAMIKPIREYLIYYSEVAKDYYFDPDTAVPYLFALVIFTAFVFGSLAWFFAFERIATGRIAVGCAVVILFSSIISVNVGADNIFLICISGYAACWMLGTNRLALRKLQTNTALANTTEGVPIYNAALCVLWIIAMLAIFLLLFVMSNGFLTLLSLVAATFVASGADKTTEYETDPIEVSKAINTMAYGSEEAAKSPQFWYMLIFILIAFAMLVFFSLRRNRSIQSMFARIRELILALINYIFGPIRYFIDVDTSDNYLNFVDEEERLHQNAKISSGDRSSRSHKRTWRDFMAEYRNIKTDAERYRFAYSEYIGLMRDMHSAMKGSDTPRESEEKLKNRAVSEDEKKVIRDISHEFEMTEFANKSADKDTVAATDALLKRIRLLLD